MSIDSGTYVQFRRILEQWLQDKGNSPWHFRPSDSVGFPLADARYDVGVGGKHHVITYFFCAHVTLQSSFSRLLFNVGYQILMRQLLAGMQEQRHAFENFIESQLAQSHLGFTRSHAQRALSSDDPRCWLDRHQARLGVVDSRWMPDYVSIEPLPLEEQILAASSLLGARTVLHPGFKRYTVHANTYARWLRTWRWLRWVLSSSSEMACEFCVKIRMQYQRLGLGDRRLRLGQGSLLGSVAGVYEQTVVYRCRGSH